MLCCAVNGSGKTLALLLPLTLHLMRQTRDVLSNNTAYPVALVVVPTRELALQVAEAAQRLAQGTHLKVSVLHGGAAIADQVGAAPGGAGGLRSGGCHCCSGCNGEGGALVFSVRQRCRCYVQVRGAACAAPAHCS